MDPLITQLSNIMDQKDAQLNQDKVDLSAAINKISALQMQLALAQNKLDNIGTVVISDIQKNTPETLWYEARDASAPKTGPHGTVNISIRDVTIVDFKPIVLPSGHSDNVYCVSRLYDKLNSLQKAILEVATKLSIESIFIVTPIANSQAVELDFQIRRSTGLVINLGLQLLPNGIIRGFDFTTKDWKQLGPKATMMDNMPISVKVEANCDLNSVNFSKVTANGIDNPLTLSHPTTKSNVLNAPYFNVAYQVDGTGDGRPYKVQVASLNASFSV